MAYRFCEAVCLNVGYMPTIYDKVTSKGMVSVLQGAVEIPYTDVYQRTSHAWGIGLDLKFGGKKN